MKQFKSLAIPDNYEDLLPELKSKTLKWQTVHYSGTKINSSATISYYETPSQNPYGNIILSPGMCTNTNIDPLMKTLTYWALSHRHNVITFDTFLGKFYDTPTVENARKITYKEFVTILESCIDFIEPYSINQQNILIGHSAGATGIIDALNNTVKKGKKTNITSVMLFAPWPGSQWFDSLKKIVYTRCESNNFKTPYGILPITNIFDVHECNHTRYVTLMPKFLSDMTSTKFRPDLMNKWDTYITIVAGEKDKKTSLELLQERFSILEKESNHKRFKFIILPNAKHSFLDVYENNRAVISLIQSQRRKSRK